MIKLRLFLAAIPLTISTAACAVPPTKNSSAKASLISLATNSDYVNISAIAGVKTDMRYATVDNFMKQDVYEGFKICYLHKEAAEQFQKAIENLHKVKPQWNFLVFDCLRPRSVQWKMWKIVEGTPNQSFVGNPAIGSIHNFGFAMDLSLIDENNNEVDMGTPFDSFSDKAQPKHEEKFIKSGELSQTQADSRRVLKDAMEGAGFKQIATEWWHFDAKPPAEVRAKYKIIE
jgi:D-alanyl-D-alanine dipeptidase